MSGLYEQDFFAWANTQAALLRSGRLAQADIAHIAEEIESMGKSELRELENRLAVLFLQLLKWQFQPQRRGRSWELTIKALACAGSLAEEESFHPLTGLTGLPA